MTNTQLVHASDVLSVPHLPELGEVRSISLVETMNLGLGLLVLLGIEISSHLCNKIRRQNLVPWCH